MKSLQELGVAQDCTSCKGTKLKDYTDFNGQDVKIFCPDCHAQGIVPTELGRQLIAFLHDNWNRQ